MGYVSTWMGYCLSALLVSLMTLWLSLVDGGGGGGGGYGAANSSTYTLPDMRCLFRDIQRRLSNGKQMHMDLTTCKYVT